MLKLPLSVCAVAILGASGVAKQVRNAVAPTAADSVAVERAYVAAVATVADSAIRRLDFFPARAQLRVQTAFLAPAGDASIPFDELAARGDAAAVAMDMAVERLAVTPVPGDLRQLHSKLLDALNDGVRATASLTTAARACQMSSASVERCQTPFSAASSRMAMSYKRYVDARNRIRMQVLDTDTHLGEFKP
jgi:hypothetical protein